MDLARLILDYVHAFIWPALLLFALIRFRSAIADLMARVASESREFSASFFGLEVAAKFQEQAASLAERAETADSPELREEWKQAARELALDGFRALAVQFDDAPLEVRREIAREMERVATTIDWKDLIPLAHSRIEGERVGAAIGLRVHLGKSREARDNAEVLSALKKLLGDRRSRVRYRAVEALRAVPDLATTLVDDLQRIAQTDRSSYVRTMAERALDAAGA